MTIPNSNSEENKNSTKRRTFLTGTGTLALGGLTGNVAAESNGEESGEKDTAESQGSPVEVYEGITFAERDTGELKLDLFVPKCEKNPPLVTYVHGGAWMLLTRKNAPDLKRYAKEWGVALATVDYRLTEIPDGVELPPPLTPDPDNPTPRGTFPAHIVDVKAAIRWLRANADKYGFDGERVATWGASAGGHLASLAGVLEDIEDIGDAYSDDIQKTVAPDQSGAVQAVIDWYGPSDLLSSFPQDLDFIPEALLVGGPLGENEERARQASPVTYVDEDSPPYLMMHGQADQTVAIEQSQILFDALRDAEVDATLFEIQDLGHVFGADSERTAMSKLTEEPRPAQHINEAIHMEEGGTPNPLVDGHPPAGPTAIRRFLTNTIDAEPCGGKWRSEEEPPGKAHGNGRN